MELKVEKYKIGYMSKGLQEAKRLTLVDLTMVSRAGLEPATL